MRLFYPEERYFASSRDIGVMQKARESIEEMRDALREARLARANAPKTPFRSPEIPNPRDPLSKLRSGVRKAFRRGSKSVKEAVRELHNNKSFKDKLKGALNEVASKFNSPEAANSKSFKDKLKGALNEVASKFNSPEAANSKSFKDKLKGALNEVASKFNSPEAANSKSFKDKLKGALNEVASKFNSPKKNLAQEAAKEAAKEVKSSGQFWTRNKKIAAGLIGASGLAGGYYAYRNKMRGEEDY